MDYTELKSTVESLTKYGADVEAVFPQAIQLAESVIFVDVIPLRNIKTVSLTAEEGSDSYILPNDFAGLVSVSSRGYRVPRVDPTYSRRQARSTIGLTKDTNTGYTLDDGKIRVVPYGYNVMLTYWRNEEPVSETNATNYILTNYPDVYLYSVCSRVFEIKLQFDASAQMQARYENSVRSAKMRERKKL